MTAVAWGGDRVVGSDRENGENANSQCRGKDVGGRGRTTRDYTSTQYGRDSCRTSSGFILNIVFIGPFCGAFRPESSLCLCIDLKVWCYRETTFRHKPFCVLILTETGAKLTDWLYDRRIVISRLSSIDSYSENAFWIVFSLFQKELVCGSRFPGQIIFFIPPTPTYLPSTATTNLHRQRNGKKGVTLFVENKTNALSGSTVIVYYAS